MENRVGTTMYLELVAHISDQFLITIAGHDGLLINSLVLCKDWPLAAKEPTCSERHFCFHRFQSIDQAQP